MPSLHFAVGAPVVAALSAFESIMRGCSAAGADAAAVEAAGASAAATPPWWEQAPLPVDFDVVPSAQVDFDQAASDSGAKTRNAARAMLKRAFMFSPLVMIGQLQTNNTPRAVVNEMAPNGSF